MAFNPSDIGIKNNNIFGLSFFKEKSRLVILPVPWEVTTSYRPGTARAPWAVLDASLQVDLYDPNIKDAWKLGIFMEPIPKILLKKSDSLRKKAEQCIEHLEKGGSIHDSKIKKLQNDINKGGKELNKFVEEKSHALIKQKKLVGILGGDHSCPLGLMRALARHHKNYGILHIDAHCDLRNKYEGFEFSHASIMFNALKIKSVKKLVQIGVRDYCEEEATLVKNSRRRVEIVQDRQIKKALFEGKTWHRICAEIIKKFPREVYISFDIDGLDPSLCPNTGTPVPGDLQYEEVFYLFEQLVKSGRRIIGFDLCEVGVSKSSDWDAIVGARILYRLANLSIKSKC